MIRDFIELLDILYQHPERKAPELLSSEEFSFAAPEMPGEGGASGAGSAPGQERPGEDFAEFEI